MEDRVFPQVTIPLNAEATIKITSTNLLDEDQTRCFELELLSCFRYCDVAPISHVALHSAVSEKIQNLIKEYVKDGVKDEWPFIEGINTSLTLSRQELKCLRDSIDFLLMNL